MKKGILVGISALMALSLGACSTPAEKPEEPKAGYTAGTFTGTSRGMKGDKMCIRDSTDHIYFAVQRQQEGVQLPNLMISEIRTMYRDEYKLALWSLNIIEQITGIRLDEDEAGYITMHIVNATMQSTTDKTTSILLFTKGVLDVIRQEFNIKLDPDQLDAARLMTHLKFLAQRIFQGESSELNEVEDMYDLLIKKDDRLKNCIINVTTYIEQTFNYTLSRQEQVYLMIHLLKVVK